MFHRFVQGVQLTVSRSAVLFSGSGCTAGGLCLRHAGRRSLLPGYKIPSTCPPTRCFSRDHSADGKLIYTGNMDFFVRGVKLFSLTTSGVNIAVMSQVILHNGLGVYSLAQQVMIYGMVGFFTFMAPLLLHLVCRNYVSRLYHKPDTDTYTAFTYSFFLMEKRCVFHQKQVRIPAISKIFTSFYAGQVGLLVNPKHFHVPQDYVHLMGYDKPFHFSSADMDTSDK